MLYFSSASGAIVDILNSISQFNSACVNAGADAERAFSLENDEFEWRATTHYGVALYISALNLSPANTMKISSECKIYSTKGQHFASLFILNVEIFVCIYFYANFLFALFHLSHSLSLLWIWALRLWAVECGREPMDLPTSTASFRLHLRPLLYSKRSSNSIHQKTKKPEIIFFYNKLYNRKL
jgi:hypothetical protein